MAYSEAAKARRRCTAETASGAPCKAWAVWDDDRQLCNVHAGRHYRVEPRPANETFTEMIAREEARLARWLRNLENPPRTNYTPCDCKAYSWPHRPGGGICNWPESPEFTHGTPAGTHRLFRSLPSAPWLLGDAHPWTAEKERARQDRRAAYLEDRSSFDD